MLACILNFLQDYWSMFLSQFVFDIIYLLEKNNKAYQMPCLDVLMLHKNKEM